MKTTLIPTPLQDLYLVDVKPFKDHRGFFIEPWSKRDLSAAGLDVDFVQEGHSRSEKGVLRGLHFQNLTAPMGKLVRCTLGEVFDVVVDIRKDSKTYGQWYGTVLSAENMKQIFVPVGFAHGFQVLSDVAELQYKQTGYYTPSAEGGLMWNDPDVNIQWPLDAPSLSERDMHHASFAEYKKHPLF